MAQKHMKKFSSSLAIKEIQIKTIAITMLLHYIAITMATIKNTNNKKCW
jgi:hypothetical protein